MRKSIEEFIGKYEVSDNGKVFSLNYNNTNQEKELKPKINKQGHLEVTLNKNDKHYYKMVSRIVWETFTGQKLCKNDILMYKDNDKTNCSFNNLYLITRGKRQEQTYDKDNRDRIKEEFYGNVLPIKEISKITNIKDETIRKRLNKGWNIYEAAEIPVAVYNRKD